MPRCGYNAAATLLQRHCWPESMPACRTRRSRLLSVTSSLAVAVNGYLFLFLLYLFGEVDWVPQNQACLLGFTSGSVTFFR
jgi:hypothetical protein